MTDDTTLALVAAVWRALDEPDADASDVREVVEMALQTWSPT